MELNSAVICPLKETNVGYGWCFLNVRHSFEAVLSTWLSRLFYRDYRDFLRVSDE